MGNRIRKKKIWLDLTKETSCDSTSFCDDTLVFGHVHFWGGPKAWMFDTVVQSTWKQAWKKLKTWKNSAWFLSLACFHSQDPTTYSTTPCRIGGIGHIINLFHFTEGDTLPWILLRLSLLLTFLLSGLLFAKMLKKRLALRFEMFTYKGSYFIITGAVLVIALAICAKVYNKIRWKIVCNDHDADCSCEDAKCGGYLSNDLHMQNNTFARLTQCGAFIADTLAVFSVLDLTLQDDSVYHISSSFNVSGFWEKHRSKILWGGFALLMILGIPSIVFSSGAFLAYQQKFSLGHRSNIGRMVVAGTLFVVDLCIVTQDLDFPHFENSLEVMLLGTNIAFEGSFINYIMVFVSMILDLNCLYTHGWYRPTDYGQFYLEKSRRICNRQHTEEYWQVNCSSPRCPLVRFSKEERDFWNSRDACEAGDLPLGSRYHPEIKEWRLFLAVVPIMAGIILFCTLFRLAGGSYFQCFQNVACEFWSFEFRNVNIRYFLSYTASGSMLKPRQVDRPKIYADESSSPMLSRQRELRTKMSNRPTQKLSKHQIVWSIDEASLCSYCCVWICIEDSGMEASNTDTSWVHENTV